MMKKRMCLKPTGVKIQGDDLLCNGVIQTSERKIFGLAFFVEEFCPKCKSFEFVRIAPTSEELKKAFLDLKEKGIIHYSNQPTEFPVASARGMKGSPASSRLGMVRLRNDQATRV